jgi:hypothetical protein
MRFNCGPTWEERYAASKQWHAKFLWLPIRIGRDCLWLESVWCRRLTGYRHAGAYGFDEWEYRRMTPTTPPPTPAPMSDGGLG